MPGEQALYVAAVSQVLNGSLTPRQILHEISAADGYRYMQVWWRIYRDLPLKRV